MNLLVFDSGIGGLGVAAEIRRLLPQAALTYLADNGFYPYGDKPDDALIARILDIIGLGLKAARPDAVVIACNTASTIALQHLRQHFAVPFIGCVPPIKPAAAISQSRHIGLLATPATVRRRYLAELVENFAGGCTVHSHGTALLADLAERKFRGQAVPLSDLARAAEPLFDQPGAVSIDAVALGCTHYTFLLDELRLLYPKIAWFDPAAPVARQTARVAGEIDSPHMASGGRALFSVLPADASILGPAFAAYGFAELAPLD
jgi:glutamate racemase